VFAVVAVVDFLDDVGIVVLCVCYLSIEVWFTFSGACLRVGWFAKLFILVCAVVVFVAGGAISFLVVYQKTSADDQVLILHTFLLLGSRLLMYLTSKTRLICHRGQ